MIEYIPMILCDLKGDSEQEGYLYADEYIIVLFKDVLGMHVKFSALLEHFKPRMRKVFYFIFKKR